MFEAGFNQAEWQEKLTSFVATGNYDFILTSNPSMPDLIAAVSPLFPKQKFICLDGMSPGTPISIPSSTIRPSRATSPATLPDSFRPVHSGRESGRKVGMIIGQHYPVMDSSSFPALSRGSRLRMPLFNWTCGSSAMV